MLWCFTLIDLSFTFIPYIFSNELLDFGLCYHLESLVSFTFAFNRLVGIMYHPWKEQGIFHESMSWWLFSPFIHYFKFQCRIQHEIGIVFSSKILKLVFHITIGSENTSKPLNWGLRNPCKVILEVYKVQSKADSIAHVPLPVIKQRPHEITTHITVVLPVINLSVRCHIDSPRPQRVIYARQHKRNHTNHSFGHFVTLWQQLSLWDNLCESLSSCCPVKPSLKV